MDRCWRKECAQQDLEGCECHIVPAVTFAEVQAEKNEEAYKTLKKKGLVAICSSFNKIGLIPSPIDVQPTIYEQAEQAIQDAKERKAERSRAKKEAEQAAADLVWYRISFSHDVSVLW